MSYLFEERKTDIKSGAELSLFGAFPSEAALRFTLNVNVGAERGYTALCGAENVKVCMIIHADEWNHSYNGRSVTYPLIEGERTDDAMSFSVELSMCELLSEYDLHESGLFYYRYLIEWEGGSVCLGGERPTALCVIENCVGERQLLLYAPEYKTSRSFGRGAVYQIFVDRFAHSTKHECKVKDGAVLDPDWENGIPQYGEYPGAEVANNVFFGGDLYGIAEKMDYIASLGVSTIYLSPIFEAYSNHKYDTGDYLTVDSMFGGEEALRELCRTAREYDIDIILDGVFNHTGDDSLYFNRYGRYPSVGAYQSKESPYHDWYSFRDFPDDYDCWWGVRVLPKIRGSSEEFRSFITEQVVPKWMGEGVSGWRLDVADELSDEFLYSFREAVKRNAPDGVILGEVWEDASDKVSYGRRRCYLGGRQLDSVMNYPLRDAVISYVMDGETEKLRRFTEGTYRRYPKGTSDNLLNFLGTHDTERILTIFGGEPCGERSNEELSLLRMTEEERELASVRLRFAYSVIAGLPGVPCIFYGDEVGVEGYRDPFCRRPFPWHSMDKVILEHYRELGRMRRDYAVLRDGLFEILALDSDVFAYVRYSTDGDVPALLLIANRTEGRTVTLPCGTRRVRDGQPVSQEYHLAPCTAEFFLLPSPEVAGRHRRT